MLYAEGSISRRRPFFRLLCLFALWASLACHAQLQPGTGYTPLTPQPVSGSKIQVREFFFYACPHCYAAEPILTPWLRRLPADVQFIRTPAVRHDSWAPLAKTFFALESLGEIGRLHLAVFDAIHQDGSSLSDEATMFDWAAAHGVERNKFAAAYNAEQTQSKVATARQMTFGYAIKNIPSFIVDGKYLVSGADASLPATLDQLIDMARKARLGNQ